MNDLAQLTLDEFLDRVAGRTAAPGGGSVAAGAGALAAALARMVVAYSIPKNESTAARAPLEAIATRLHRADEVLRALITRDATAYTAMVKARPPRGGEAGRETYQQAVLGALAVPMETAAAVAAILGTLDGFKEQANKNLLSDLVVAATLAAAAARAARYMVRVNAPEVADPGLRDRLLSDIDAIVERCDAASRSIESFVGARV